MFFQWDGSGSPCWYYEEEYIKHLKTLHEEVDNAPVHGEVNQKKPMDKELAKNLSLLVRIAG